MSKTFSVLVVGDTHGNMSWLHDVVIPHAVRTGVSKILQVGDFGFVWDGNAKRHLDKLNRILGRHDLDFHFLPGNHENYDMLEDLAASVEDRSPEGHIPFRERVFYTGKVSSWTWAGRRCAAVGGATSIDRRYRVPYRSWWPEEALSPEEAVAARALGKVDVLFAHDSPSQVPFVLLPDPDSTAHRQVMTDVGRALRPSKWFHGHYHVRAEYSFMHDDGYADVVSLDRDGSEPEFGMQVLKLSEL